MKTETSFIFVVVVVGVILSAATIFSTYGREKAATSTTTLLATTTAAETTTTEAPTTTTPKTTSSSTTSAETTTSTYAAASDYKAEMAAFADKGIYHSGDMLTLSVSLDSAQDLPGAQLKVYGIMSGYYRINAMEKLDIEAGKSTSSFSYKTPRCYSCGGINPGKYNITAELIYGGKIIASSTSEFEMQQ